MSDADEVAELKYEAVKWKRAHDAVESKLMEVCEENAHLKAEVERLDKLVRFWSDKYKNENARFLRACERIKTNEGKQS